MKRYDASGALGDAPVFFDSQSLASMQSFQFPKETKEIERSAPMQFCGFAFDGTTCQVAGGNHHERPKRFVFTDSLIASPDEKRDLVLCSAFLDMLSRDQSLLIVSAEQDRIVSFEHVELQGGICHDEQRRQYKPIRVSGDQAPTHRSINYRGDLILGR